MRILRAIADVREALSVRRGATLGFVPTMGALHDGHTTLFRRARTECDIVIVSKRNKEFQEVMAKVPPGVTVIDLVRIVEPSQVPSGYEGICW